jgi:mannan endo-1,4-beta-mannosidase
MQNSVQSMGVIGLLAACLVPRASTMESKPQTGATWFAGVSGKRMSEVLRVDGRRLLDPCGEAIVIRGVEDNVHSSVAEMAKSGANAVRFVYKMDTAELEQRIKEAVEHHMLVSFISPKGYADTSWWNQPDVKAVLMKYQAWLLPHAYGEGAYQKNNTRWLREAKKVVKDLRSFGYKFPIEILADQWGQSLETLLDCGKQIVEADPEHNILLGNQMYSQNHPDDATMAKIVKSGLPIMVGTCTFRNPEKPSEGWYGAPLLQYQKVWEKTYENGIGSFYWNWATGGDALTTNGKCGSWTVPGDFICGSGPYAMPRVSKKTHWMLTGACHDAQR